MLFVHRRNQKNATVMNGPMSTRIGSVTLKNAVIPTVHKAMANGRKMRTVNMIPAKHMKTGRKSSDNKQNGIEPVVNQINAMSP